MAIFTLPFTTEQSTVCHLRGPMRLEELCLFIVSEHILGAQVAQDWESPSLPPPNPHTTEVKMDGMVTVMNAWSDRWMNGVTWWLDNRNYPQDQRSKCCWGPQQLSLVQGF